MLTSLRRALNSATRYRAVRAPTLAAIGGVTGVSTRLLRELDGVAAVYARGSYARDDFRPFISDIDFAIAVGAPPGEGYERCRRLHRRLALVRSLNPFVRDPWQTIVTAPQWPLVGRYGRLFGTEDWRLLTGTPPWGEPEPVDPRVELAAWWNRQHFWTATGVRQMLTSRTSVRELESSLKKARRFARRLETPAAGPATPQGALVELDRSAARLARDLGLPAAWRPSAERLGPPTASDRERRALRAIESALDLERDGATVLASEGVLYVVSGRALTAEEYRIRLAALAEVRRGTGVLALLYSQAAFALTPLTRRLRVLRAGEMMRGPADGADPHLLREQLLYQSLYLGTHLWVAAGRSKPGPGLERHVADALEACGWFAGGARSPDAGGVRDTLARVAPLDPELAERLRKVRGLERPTPSVLFEVGSLAVERLAEHLLRLGEPASRVPVAAAS